MPQAGRTRVERIVSQSEYNRAEQRARTHRMTRPEREAQLVSYVWGNAPEGDTGTLKTVRENLDLVVEE